jgi:signal transduction protein with GAF and PtsI domain
MTQLSTKIKLYANREIDFRKDVKLQDNSDGKGVFIAEWNLDIPKPTLEQLDVYEAQAKIVESNQAQVNKRITEYGSIAEQIEYITENGLNAWQSKVAEIKAKYPKENN